MTCGSLLSESLSTSLKSSRVLDTREPFSEAGAGGAMMMSHMRCADVLFARLLQRQRGVSVSYGSAQGVLPCVC